MEGAGLAQNGTHTALGTPAGQTKLRLVKTEPCGPCRVFELTNHTEMHAHTWATYLVAKTQNKPHLVPMGWAATRG